MQTNANPDSITPAHISPRGKKNNAIAAPGKKPDLKDAPLNGAGRLKPIEWVCEILCLKKSAVHAKVKDGVLPAPVKFGASRRAAARWIDLEIYEFIQGLAEGRYDSNVASRNLSETDTTHAKGKVST